MRLGIAMSALPFSDWKGTKEGGGTKGARHLEAGTKMAQRSPPNFSGLSALGPRDWRETFGQQLPRLYPRISAG